MREGFTYCRRTGINKSAYILITYAIEFPPELSTHSASSGTVVFRAAWRAITNSSDASIGTCGRELFNVEPKNPF